MADESTSKSKNLVTTTEKPDVNQVTVTDETLLKVPKER